MEWTECSETLAYKIQMLGDHPKEKYNRNKITWKVFIHTLFIVTYLNK